MTTPSPTPGTPIDFTTPEGCHKLRVALRRAMPPEAFEPTPWRGLAALAQVPIYASLMAAITSDVFPWWGDVLAGLAIGQMVTSVSLIAHETLHRTNLRSRFGRQLVGWLGFSWYLFGPGTWHAWHVLAHHGNTQSGDADPDMLMTLDRYHRSLLARWIHAVTPGSGHWLSVVSPTFLFAFQGQLFLWYYADLPEMRPIKMDRRRERAISLALIGAWTALGVWMGPWAALWAIVVPMATANATLMMYIMTNHWVRPMTPAHNNPFTNTTSVTVPRWMDLIHVEFSYHQEHHIFPQMSPAWFPMLRQRLRELAPEAVAAYPVGSVLRALYRTPSLYRDADTLVHADDSGAVRLADVDAGLRAGTDAPALAASP